jgi:hypothetical protein
MFESTTAIVINCLFHSTKADADEFLLSDFQSHQIGLSAILQWSTGILEISGK